MPVPLKLFLATALTAVSLAAQTTLTESQLMTRCDPPPGSLGGLTRNQKEGFQKSQAMFVAGHYGDALGELRGLLAQLPQNSSARRAMAERTAEAALEAGDRAYAISLLKPIEERDGNDCSARTLMARAYAEDERSAECDAEISTLTALHKQAPESPAGKLDVFLLEQRRLKGGGVVRIWNVLQPFGPLKTHLYSEIFDGSGSRTLTIELNSDDGLQVYFREIHPDLAAKGDRRFSLDDVADRPLPDGTVDHATIQFFDGRPSYEAVRERILTIAEKSANPVS